MDIRLRFRSRSCRAVVLLLSATLACAGSEESEGGRTETEAGDDELSNTTSAADLPSHLGGCILLEPAATVPDDVYAIGDVRPAAGIDPFSKELNVYGLRLVARDDASDDFLRLVAKTVVEMFPRSGDLENLDLAMQREVLANHHRYRALIPVPVGEDFAFMEDNPEQFERLTRENSVCDVIMQDVPHRQVMEVVEHILHYVSDLGLHYAFPEVWGISDDSELARAMQKAIASGYYDVSSYDGEFEEAETRHRVLMQEFAYWFISTAWDLQEPYGPVEDEWQIRTADELRSKLPEMYEAFEGTVARVMTAPSAATLREIGPTRAEEDTAP